MREPFLEIGCDGFGDQRERARLGWGGRGQKGLRVGRRFGVEEGRGARI